MGGMSMPEPTATENPTTQNPVNWTYKIREHKSLIKAPQKDANGNPLYKDGKPVIKAFMMFRYRLVLHSEKYGAVIEYNINKPNRAKKVPFFSHRENKKQFMPVAMQRHLVGRFTAVEAQQIVKECLAAVGG
jgi:hypothetical protein